MAAGTTSAAPSIYYGAASARDVDFSQSEVWSTTATLDHEFSDTLRLHNAFRYYDYSLDRQNTIPNVVNETAQAVKVLAGLRYDRFRQEVHQRIAGQPDLARTDTFWRPTLTPTNSASLWLMRSFGDRFGLGGGINYVGDRQANLASTLVLPEYLTADAMACTILGQLKAQINIRNIFDRDFIVSGHGTVGNLNMPGAPRSVMLTLRYAID